jgi:hypothetical protein
MTRVMCNPWKKKTFTLAPLAPLSTFSPILTFTKNDLSFTTKKFVTTSFK